MPRPVMPAHVAALASELAGLPGTVAVALGGSRATGDERPDSGWDLGLYYRGSRRPLDPADVRRLGHEGYVSELGEWGPIVHGGGWLTVEGTPVDVLFRDHGAATARRPAPRAPSSARPSPPSPRRCASSR